MLWVTIETSTEKSYFDAKSVLMKNGKIYILLTNDTQHEYEESRVWFLFVERASEKELDNETQTC